MFIIQVALPFNFINTFDYKLPKNINIPMIGSRVIVPFKKKKTIGIVVKYNNKSKIQKNKLKNLEYIIDYESIFTNDIWSLLLWSSEYYHYPIGKILFFTLPKLLRQGKIINLLQTLQWKINNQKKNIDLNNLNCYLKQQNISDLTQLKHTYNNQTNKFNTNKITSNKLKKKEQIKLSKIKLINNKYNLFLKTNKNLSLNNLQTIAVKSIKKNENYYSTWLLYEKNKSEKIKIYIKILENILSQNKQALILIPEIELTLQITKLLQKQFNVIIDVLHSKINNKDQLNIWLRAKSGKNAIIIGTRSALFTPFLKLGIIIIDEEHNEYYKQQNGWCYNARDLAILRAKINNIPIILGTATPSFETLANIHKKKYNQLNLTTHKNNKKNISQYLIDLKKQKVKFGISNILFEHLKKHLEKKNKVILFLNRRGYSQILICCKCNWIAQCKSCNQKYTFYKKNNKLTCNYCNKNKQIPKHCPVCNYNYLITTGVGTEQLEEGISKIFPKIHVTRIDKDTTKNNNKFKEILNKINLKEPHILIGTQITSRSYYLQNVTLIALLDIDTYLFSNNFRAIEHFSQIYTQMLRHTDIHKKQIEIFLQTHHPEHQLLTTLLKKGYNAFALEAMKERYITMLPPYSNHILIRSEDYNNKYAQNFLYKIKQLILQQTTYNTKLYILGPSPSNQIKQNGRFVWNLILQHESKIYLQKIITKLLPEFFKQTEINKIKWNINVDPNNI